MELTVVIAYHNDNLKNILKCWSNPASFLFNLVPLNEYELVSKWF